ncbi:MAG TPA: hypothetical protein VNI77_08360 [Nitrososphaera sp.]|nr:hypothetical protein [Nitrososphaera sp.]
MEHTQHSSHLLDSYKQHGADSESEHIIIRKIAVHEKLAEEMKKSGVDCVTRPLGSHKLEREETYYSHAFALSPRVVTNKGIIEIRGRNIDFVQVLQRV